MPAGRSNLLEGQEHTEFFEDLSRARDDEHGIAKVALQTNDYWSRVRILPEFLLTQRLVIIYSHVRVQPDSLQTIFGQTSDLEANYKPPAAKLQEMSALLEQRGNPTTADFRSSFLGSIESPLFASNDAPTS